MHTSIVRRLFHLSWPVLIGQFASMGMMVSDTMQVARYATADLAAVAVGSGIYISVVMALVGILAALSPTIAHLYGARRNDEIGPQFQQGVWLALFLAVPGTIILLFPDPLLALSKLAPPVEAKARSYLSMLAFAVPPVMLYRAFYGFNQAIGRPRPMMVIALAGTAIHVPLSYVLIHGAGPFPELGALGCGISNLVVALLGCAAGAVWLSTGTIYQPYHLFAHWHGPQRAALGALLRLGAPMGFSTFVEVTSFTLIALFVARLGAEVVAGHRVIANLHALMFMMPLSLATATLVLVGHAAGAQDWLRARATAIIGIAVAGGLALLFGISVWLARGHHRRSLLARSRGTGSRARADRLFGGVPVLRRHAHARVVLAARLQGQLRPDVHPRREFLGRRPRRRLVARLRGNRQPGWHRWALPVSG